MMGCRALAVGLALAVMAPLAARNADAAVVICQKKNKLKLRVDTCTAKETQVDASELGVVGPPGAPGNDGADGSAVAYAHILSDGTVDLARSKNITQANVSKQLTSAYCFSGLTFSFQNVVATPDYGDSTTGGVTGLEATVGIDLPWNDCSGVIGTQAEIATAIGGTFAPASFYVIFN
jgi:hypothetical protein